jgi:DNA-binding response OmpR family regulator
MAIGSVLVVEDDPEINGLVGAYAELCGFEYRSALNGTSAINQARQEAPSAVILDLMLPDIDGFEVCRRLRKEPATVHTPIVILSALGDERNKAAGKACGADQYLTKPFDPENLMEVLRGLSAGGR